MRSSTLFSRNNFILYATFCLGLTVSYYLSFDPLDCTEFSNLVPFIGLGGDEYEPLIKNPVGTPSKEKKSPQNLIRPRYYSSELGIRQKLLVGVLTSGRTIRKFAVPINKTVTPFVDKLLFFLDAKSAEKENARDLKIRDIVGFVDHREIFKPFHMLKYLAQNFINDYDYFFIVRDTTYIDARRLMRHVEKISVSLDVHAGPEKVGDSAFCSLDGGILLSNSVMRKVEATLSWCVKGSLSSVDDENVGRCIIHATELPCRHEVQGLYFTDFVLSDEENLDGIQSLDEPTGLTYHRILKEETFYKIHLHLSEKHLAQTKKKSKDLKRALDIKTEGVSWPPGSYPSKKPNTRFDVLRWDYFDQISLYLPSTFVNKAPLTGSDLMDIQNVVNTSVTWLNFKYRWQINYLKLVNGYRRFDPSRGLDYMLDLAFRTHHGQEVIKRVQVSKPLGTVELLPMPYVTENTKVTVILPVHQEDKEIVIGFMNKYSQVLMGTVDLTCLLLVFIYEPKAPGKGHVEDVFKEIKELAYDLSVKYEKNNNEVIWVSIRIPEFQKGPLPLFDDLLYFAITDLALKKVPEDTIILMAEPTMEINTDYINRVRMNTILGIQVFCPIPFSEFHPEIIARVYGTEYKERLDWSKKVGHFDAYNTRHVSFYPADYIEARSKVYRGLPEVKVDKDIKRLTLRYEADFTGANLLSMFTRSDLIVLRATEPALLLRHPTYSFCHRLRFPQEQDQCMEASAYNQGSRTHLAAFVLNISLS